jgi:hypothetical protein
MSDIVFIVITNTPSGKVGRLPVDRSVIERYAPVICTALTWNGVIKNEFTYSNLIAYNVARAWIAARSGTPTILDELDATNWCYLIEFTNFIGDTTFVNYGNLDFEWLAADTNGIDRLLVIPAVMKCFENMMNYYFYECMTNDCNRRLNTCKDKCKRDLRRYLEISVEEFELKRIFDVVGPIDFLWSKKQYAKLIIKNMILPKTLVMLWPRLQLDQLNQILLPYYDHALVCTCPFIGKLDYFLNNCPKSMHVVMKMDPNDAVEIMQVPKNKKARFKRTLSEGIDALYEFVSANGNPVHQPKFIDHRHKQLHELWKKEDDPAHREVAKGICDNYVLDAKRRLQSSKDKKNVKVQNNPQKLNYLVQSTKHGGST